jgi:hypothetical protein
MYTTAHLQIWFIHTAVSRPRHLPLVLEISLMLTAAALTVFAVLRLIVFGHVAARFMRVKRGLMCLILRITMLRLRSRSGRARRTGCMIGFVECIPLKTLYLIMMFELDGRVMGQIVAKVAESSV